MLQLSPGCGMHGSQPVDCSPLPCCGVGAEFVAQPVERFAHGGPDCLAALVVGCKPAALIGMEQGAAQSPAAILNERNEVLRETRSHDMLVPAPEEDVEDGRPGAVDGQLVIPRTEDRNCLIERGVL